MISIREQDYGLDVALFNEFSLADFKLFEDALVKRVAEQGKPDVLLDLTELVDFTLDMAVEEVKFVRAHEQDFGRIALVVSDVDQAGSPHCRPAVAQPSGVLRYGRRGPGVAGRAGCCLILG
jgi:hypothetical protein